MSRPPSIQWYYKQWLGDNKVLAMDWDVRGMHMHLLMLSIQEEPPGTIPADDAAIRRWLSLPLGSVDADQTWRRVKSQLLAAWQPEGDRLANSGMKATLDRAENYRNRYENGTKKPRESIKTEEVIVLKDSSKSKPSLKEVLDYCLERKNTVDPQKFLDYYTANGWKVGRNSMKDWKAAVRTWEANSREQTSGNSKAQERVSRNRAAILEGLGYSPNARPGGADSPPRSESGGGPLLGGGIQERKA